MKKSFEYDQTKYDPNAPTRTEQFLTADGVKTLTSDANDGAVLIQDSVDPDSLNPVTAAAVATAVAGASGEVPVIGNDDNGKVLTAVVDGSSKSVAWETPSGSSYDAGDGIAISEGTISAKVDGTSITVNESGQLKALGGGVGTLGYTYRNIDLSTQTVSLPASLPSGVSRWLMEAFIVFDETVPAKSWMVTGTPVTLRGHTDGAYNICLLSGSVGMDGQMSLISMTGVVALNRNDTLVEALDICDSAGNSIRADLIDIGARVTRLNMWQLS